jgi:hypothetical protein
MEISSNSGKYALAYALVMNFQNQLAWRPFCNFSARWCFGNSYK